MLIAIPDHLLRLPPLEAPAVARELGFDGIELTVGGYNAEAHPLLHTQSAAALGRRAAEADITLASASAGFVARWGLIDPQPEARWKAVTLLGQLLSGCQPAGIGVLHLPCHGASEPRRCADRELLLEELRPIVQRAAELGIELAVDTLEPADQCRDWLTTLASPAARAACDVGNARAVNRDVVTELQLLSRLLAQVRLRDRARREPFASVPLGEGGVDLSAALRALARQGFGGWLVLETPGGDEPRRSARRNLEYVRTMLASAPAR
jgi:sugar phosphate isomerase/epimerase